ncbi:hypothetical protein RND81_13G076700 [Saponaria officinalis]|uniref:Uncharacterized protein n=1 Tax=Saponaria officinalis TaxID=3572 RepID=A0AAW1GV13_SAPOF
MVKTSVTQVPNGAASSLSEPSGLNKTRPVSSGSSVRMTLDRQPAKRKEMERKEDDETATIQSQSLPKDAFRLRQMQKARKGTARGGTATQTSSASYGSAFSGEQSGSTS